MEHGGIVRGAAGVAAVRLAVPEYGLRRAVEMLTVRDMVEVTGVRVVAGEGGLDRPVRWVHISELSDPTPWLNGGELLLTTGMTVNGDGGEYIRRIAAYGLAGLGVGIQVGGLEAVSPDMLQAADELDFPVLEVPYETPFIALTEKAFTHIAAEQATLLRGATAAHDRLERVALSEGGLDGLTTALGEQIGGCAAVCDARGEVLAGAPPDDGLILEVPGDSGATLRADRVGAPLTELDRLVVHQAVTIVALELLRRRVAADTERRLAGDVLASLLSGALEGDELQRRLKPFGLTDAVAAIVAADAAYEALGDAVRQEAGAGLVAHAGGLACALVPGTEDVFELAERIRVRADVPAGASRAVAITEARRAFHEARWALEAAQLDADTARLFTYRDLGSFQLLLAMQDDDALRTFCDSILSPLEGGEGAESTYGTELLRSLEVFIECNGQWERAARKLYCHRHTLRYRIQRVEQLTGRSLDSARDRIDFWLALRGRELLN
jgi:purine catabolism regulator